MNATIYIHAFKICLIFLLKDTAHIVRTVSCETLDDEDDDDERFMQKHNIGTADSWMTYVLQDKLIRPSKFI